MNNNQIILNRLSQYLNFCEKSIDDSQIKAVTACGVSIKEAYILLLQEYLNLDYNFKREYLEEMVNIEDPTDYLNWDSSRQIFAFLPFMKMTFCG